MDVLSRTLAAVADPTRRSMLGRLAEGPATVGELARAYPMSQQAVSKHVARLVRARLVEKRRDGRIHRCTLDARPLQEVADWAAGFRKFWEESFGRLDAFLDELKTKDPRHGR